MVLQLCVLCHSTYTVVNMYYLVILFYSVCSQIIKRIMHISIGTNNMDDEWLEYDFGQNRHITKVKTMGRPHYSQYVTSYMLKVWQNEEWISLSDGNGDSVVSIDNLIMSHRYYLQHHVNSIK